MISNRKSLTSGQPTHSRQTLKRMLGSAVMPFLEQLEPRQLMSVTTPILVVTGNSLPINFHDSSPSLTDNTDFGSLTGGITTRDKTFVVSNGGIGTLSLTGLTPVTITGSNAADFSAGSVVNHTDGTMSVTVHYAPTAAGTSNAILHIASNDPKHADFSFAIRGAINFTDYGISVGNFKVPVAGEISDGMTQFVVPIGITNIGGLAVNGTAAFTDVTLFLKNSSTGVETPVATVDHVSLAGLGLNSTRNVSAKFTMPFGLTAGTYTVVAHVNDSASIVETNPLNTTPLVNNSAAGLTMLNVTQGHIDLVGNLVSETLPPAVLTDAAFTGKLTVSVKNLGNVTLPPAQKFTLEVRAHSGGGDIVLGTFSNLTIGKLKGNQSKTFSVSVNSTAGLDAGTYQIQAFITPTPALSEDGTVNNLITQTASGQTFSLISGGSFVNLTGVLGKSSVPLIRLADTSIKGTLQVTVTNSGNTTLSSSQTIRLEIFASGLPLTVSGLLNAKSMKPGESRTFTVPINVSAGLSVGSYVLQAQIDTVPTISESSTGDNLVTVNGLGASIPLTIT